ncbi:MAG: YafY family transcriptional regulator [Alicyclobacillus sp.]|nr:YafY family transcriptional regulator [Alicyclobacillus sp.]
MSKSKRLMELMMAVNRKRKFTVKELADEFNVSARTILRDLQELSELGVPLYSEVGPHGGYRVLKERILPPISLTEDEAVAIFFAIHALRHYVFIPFEAEFSSALNKFYYYMPEDVRNRIDAMKNRLDFVTPTRQVKSPFLSLLLEAALHQNVIRIEYESREGTSSREIQPIGVYAHNGFWYCPAYCFLRRDFRVFRCDRIVSATSSTSKPMDLQHVHLGNRKSFLHVEQPCVDFYVELSREGVQRCETELWPAPRLHVRKDGTGWLDGSVPKSDIPFFAKFFVGLGNDVTVKNPPELIDHMRQTLSEIMDKYT